MTDVESAPETVAITVDGHEIQAKPGALIIDACETAGVYIPRFCYHERMNPVGMCRMCLVEVDTGRGPALSPSCMLTVSPGMVVSTDSEPTKKAQDGVLEFLLLNHPLDCPVCDKGGECPLQDQTMSHGPGESRFIEEKRHFEKPIAINENVYLDRERCILCDRCTRFADEVVGDPLIHFIHRGNQTEVNTFPDHAFASYFSGNVVQICPVGALTAKPYRFKARPWDLEEVVSTYPDPMGDRIAVQSSRNQVLRFQGVDSDAVNWGWLADRERFAFEAFQSESRLTEPLVRGGGLNKPDPDGDELVGASWSTALGLAASAIAAASPDRVAVIGGARLTNEAQYSWTKLAKGVIGTDHVDATLGDELPAHVLLGMPRATIAEACRPGGAVVLLGVDPKEEHGTLYIRLRHAVREDGAVLVELTPASTGMANVAAARLHPRPGEEHLLARALVSSDTAGDVAGVPAAAINAARAAIGDRPLTVVAGRGSLASSPDAIVAALSAFAEHDGCRFLLAPHRGNVMGALDMGMAPGLLPGRTTLDAGRSSFADVWPSVPKAAGLDTPDILEAAAAGKIDVLVLLGADPLSDAPDVPVAAAALDRVGTVIAVDLFANASVAKADIVLPAAAFTETSGTHTNMEGRISPIRQKVTPPGTARADWIIAAELALRLGADLGIESVEDVWAELAPRSAVHGDVSIAAVDAADPEGLLLTATGRVAFTPHAGEIAVKPADSYALRLVVTRRMFDQGTVLANTSGLANLGGEAALRLNSYDFNRLGIAEGGEVGMTSTSGSMRVRVVTDASVPRGVALVDHNRPGIDARKLYVRDEASVDVRLEAGGAR